MYCTYRVEQQKRRTVKVISRVCLDVAVFKDEGSLKSTDNHFQPGIHLGLVNKVHRPRERAMAWSV